MDGRPEPPIMQTRDLTAGTTSLTRAVAIIITVLMLAYPASAWAWDDPADDWDARILHAIDDPATWGMVLSELDTWPEDMWGMVEAVDVPPVSQATRAAIRDRLAIDNRIPDNRFSHMPVASEGWLMHLLVDACIIAVLIVIWYVAPYVVSVATGAREIITSAHKAVTVAREADALLNGAYLGQTLLMGATAYNVLHMFEDSATKWWLLKQIWEGALSLALKAGDAHLIAEAKMGVAGAIAHISVGML